MLTKYCVIVGKYQLQGQKKVCSWLPRGRGRGGMEGEGRDGVGDWA